MNQLTPRHRIDTMARLSNEDMADMHMAYGAGNGNARGAVWLYQECLPGACLQT